MFSILVLFFSEHRLYFYMDKTEENRMKIGIPKEIDNCTIVLVYIWGPIH